MLVKPFALITDPHESNLPASSHPLEAIFRWSNAWQSIEDVESVRSQEAHDIGQ